MYKIILITLSIFLLTNPYENSNSDKSPEKVKKDKTVKLFNGKDLTGWYTFLKGRGRDNDPKNVFTVRDGMIHISGEEWGCITTTDEYENYRILIEFKWGEINHPPRQEKARDSGLLIHSQGEDGAYGGIWMYSIECQMIEGGTGDILVVGDKSDKFSATATVAAHKQGNSFVFQPDGHKETINSGRINWYGRAPEWKDTLGFRGKNDAEKPLGKWNRMECIADGDQITIFVNEKLVNKITNVKPHKGKIQIQSESAELFVRRIELTPLH